MNVAYDSAEFTPFVLHFTNELAPPATGKRFVQRAIHKRWGDVHSLVLTNNEICVYGIQRYTKYHS